MGTRIRVEPDGEIKLPAEISRAAGWPGGSYIEVSVDSETVSLRRVEVDLFAEATREPDADAFDKILENQKKNRDNALREFEERTGDADEKPG